MMIIFVEQQLLKWLKLKCGNNIKIHFTEIVNDSMNVIELIQDKSSASPSFKDYLYLESIKWYFVSHQCSRPLID
jgi:hypothetical protein